MCPHAIRFESPAHVELFGKGRKSRVCPLWPETGDLVRALLRRQPRPDHPPIFVNCYGRPLGAAGVRFKLKQYVQPAAHEALPLAKKRVGPHTFRHSVGVRLVAAASMRPSSAIGSDTLDWTLPTCTYERISKQNAKHSIRSMRRPNPLNHHGGSMIQSY